MAYVNSKPQAGQNPQYVSIEYHISYQTWIVSLFACWQSHSIDLSTAKIRMTTKQGITAEFLTHKYCAALGKACQDQKIFCSRRTTFSL
jgi:hypothetical protein